MNCPLLPLMPAFEDELGVDELDADEVGLVDDALVPLDVLIDPFHAPRQPV